MVWGLRLWGFTVGGRGFRDAVNTAIKVGDFGDHAGVSACKNHSLPNRIPIKSPEDAIKPTSRKKPMKQKQP